MTIHHHAAAGNVAACERALASGMAVDALDQDGQTPLMAAVASPLAGLDVLQFLVNQGANVNALSTPTRENRAAQSVLAIAAKAASLEKIRFLVAAGADVNFVDAHGYSILLAALYGSFAYPVNERLERLSSLVDAGAPLNVASKYGESVLRTSSIAGEFQLVKFFLDRGADPTPLGWSPLFFAVAFGSAEKIAELLDRGADLTEVDSWERTPFLLSVHAGRMEIARLLLARGSDRRTTARCGTTALMLAISRDDSPMLEWLVSEGWNVEETNEFGNFPLMEAAQHDAVSCVKILLKAGALASRKNEYDRCAMSSTASTEIVDLLVEVGEDLSDVDSEMRSRLTGFWPRKEFEVSPDVYHRHRSCAFGKRNPERVNNPFWEAMVRTRQGAYSAKSKFGESPVWCFQRYGQSLTRLPDGRYVEIGGEHEDHYDPDFCIYNDVVVHHGDGTFDILGYPEADFPTTDFHSATLVPPYIYIIGNLGYPHQRKLGETPVYRLHCETWRITKVQTTGEMPGWLHRHKATLVGDSRIRIRGGKIVDGAEHTLIDNSQSFILDLANFGWRRELA